MRTIIYIFGDSVQWVYFPGILVPKRKVMDGVGTVEPFKLERCVLLFGWMVMLGEGGSVCV